MKRLKVLAWVAVIAALFVFQRGARFADLAELREVSTLLEDIVAEEHAIDEKLLRARFGLDPTYDPLNQSLQSILVSVSQLERGVAAEFRQSHPQFDEATLRYIERLGQRKVALDRFKSRNSVLRNSVRNLPAALGRLSGDDADKLALLSGIQQFELSGDARWANDTRPILDAIRVRAETEAEAKVVVLHADHVLRGGPEVDGLVEVFLRAPAADRGEALRDTFTDAYISVAHEAEIFRLLLFATSIGLLLYIGLTVTRLWLASRSLARANEALAAFGVAAKRFVPQDFLTHLDRDTLSEVELGDNSTRTMTVLFSDIRAFTTLSEGMTPQETFAFINGYLTRMGPVVRDNRGFIDKYIGDAIMALFDVAADDAVEAALAMLRALDDLNQERGVPISIGLGLHTGEMVLGTVGEDDRMESTVISDAVNIAARLETMTKTYDVPLLISEDTVQALKDPTRFQLRAIDRVRLKGKQVKVTVYEVFDHESAEARATKQKTVPLMAEAIALMSESRYGEALKRFEAARELSPGDPIINAHLETLMTRSVGAA